MPSFSDLFPNLAKLKKDAPDAEAREDATPASSVEEAAREREDAALALARSDGELAERAAKDELGDPTAKDELGDPTAEDELGDPTAKDELGDPTAEDELGDPTAEDELGDPTAEDELGDPTAKDDPVEPSVDGETEAPRREAPIAEDETVEWLAATRIAPLQQPAKRAELKVSGPTRARRPRRGEETEDEARVIHEWVAPGEAEGTRVHAESAAPLAESAAPVEDVAPPAESVAPLAESVALQGVDAADAETFVETPTSTGAEAEDAPPERGREEVEVEDVAERRAPRGPLEAAVLGIAGKLSSRRGGGARSRGVRDGSDRDDASDEPVRGNVTEAPGDATARVEPDAMPAGHADVEAPDDEAAVLPEAPTKSKRRLAPGGGAASLKRFGNLRSLKNANLSLGRGGRTTSLIGLDIQPGYVTAVDADVNGVVAVKRAVGLALPADTMREGEVVDATLLSEALHELFAKAGLSKRVRVGLANQRTVVRTMELPPIEDRKELAAAVAFQAQDQIPMPLTSAVLDFQPLGVVQTPSGRRQRVVVVAAQREMVQRLVGAVSAAGLRAEAVDLSAFAMIRALYRADDGGQPAGTGEQRPEAAPALGTEAEATEEPLARTLFLNVGGLTNLAIAEGTTCRFTRAVGGGLESMASAVAERRSIPLVEARAALAAFDLTKRGPSVGGGGAGPEAPVTDAAGEEEIRAVVTSGLRDIAGEVRNSLDFHRAQESGAVDRVVLSGAALEMNGFASALEAELGFSVERRSVASSRGGELNGIAAERLAVAAGLAVEEVAR